MKEYNKHAILRLVKEKGPVSCTEISRALNISRTTATVLANELCSSGLLKEIGYGESRGGRKPILFVFNPDYASVGSIELGATRMALALTDLNARVFAYDEGTIGEPDPGSLVEVLVTRMRSLLKQANIPEDQLLGLGVSVPGLVDSETGKLLKAVNLGWENVPLRSLLGQRLQVPIYILDKGDAGALGEKWFGAARQCDDFIYVTVGTGVGSGIISGGQLYRGARHAAGELGHITVVPNGPRCRCGNVGCVELYCSASAIARGAAAKSEPGSTLATKPDLTCRDVYEAALGGDKCAIEAFREAGTFLGVACVTLVHLFNPAMLVFGGGVAQAGELILEPVRAVLKDRLMRTPLYDVEVAKAGLGVNSGLIGAAAYVIQESLAPRRVVAGETQIMGNSLGLIGR
ncbi:MAG: ROK family protein [Firmicutes bacterium]|nr:ROK family protein [Bacillota bacterium]